MIKDRTTMDCKTFTRLWTNSKGDQLSAEVLSHIGQCAECRSKVEKYRQTLSLLNAAPALDYNAAKVEREVMAKIASTTAPVSRSAKRRRIWIASAAASAALLLATTGVAHYLWFTEKTESEAIVEMISGLATEQSQPREKTSSFPDLATLENLLSE